MRYVKPEPKDIKGNIKLDMRVSDKQGEDLAAEIAYSIERGQRFIVTTLPDVLVVTQKQFVSLQPYTQAMYNTTDRMYVTPWNVMEVVIDRDIDIVPEVENVIADTEQLQQAIDEAKQENDQDDSSSH